MKRIYSVEGLLMKDDFNLMCHQGIKIRILLVFLNYIFKLFIFPIKDRTRAKKKKEKKSSHKRYSQRSVLSSIYLDFKKDTNLSLSLKTEHHAIKYFEDG